VAKYGLLVLKNELLKKPLFHTKTGCSSLSGKDGQYTIYSDGQNLEHKNRNAKIELAGKLQSAGFNSNT